MTVLPYVAKTLISTAVMAQCYGWLSYPHKHNQHSWYSVIVYNICIPSTFEAQGHIITQTTNLIVDFSSN